MATCFDPRHDDPCPDCESCTACMTECSTDYWQEQDGTPWGEVTLQLNGQMYEVN